MKIKVKDRMVWAKKTRVFQDKKKYERKKYKEDPEVSILEAECENLEDCIKQIRSSKRTEDADTDKIF